MKFSVLRMLWQTSLIIILAILILAISIKFPKNQIGISQPILIQNMAESEIPESAKLVDIKTINPEIILDIRYATTNNFLNQKLYPVAKCALRKEVAEKLSQVQTDLEIMGLGLKVYDCYRPLSVTKKMWEVLPDSRYVANPAKGSRHNRGAAVDVSLIDLSTGKELEMPTEFDDFSEQAWRSYLGNKPEVQRNSELLENQMKKYGFEPLMTEWWHFDAVGWEKFSLLDVPLDEISTAG
ncbi:MAG: M15 family metallopeptidase [Microcoleaceae cyanobacterium]